MFAVLYRHDPAAPLQMETFGNHSDADQFAYNYLSTCGSRSTAVIVKTVEPINRDGSREKPRLHGSVGNAAVQP